MSAVLSGSCFRFPSRHLIVLTYGYGYADTVPCEGGQPIRRKEGWLTTAQMETFNGWLRLFAPVYAEDNYFDGQGTDPATTAEIDEMAQWAGGVYTRLGE